MSNAVEVDPVALAAEAERAIAGAFEQPAGDVPAGQEGPAPVVDSWRPLIEGLTPTVRMTVFAQWTIAPNMQEEFVASLSQSLDLLFPGGLNGKYAAIARVLICCCGITFMNYSANGNKLPPLGLKKADDKKQAVEQRAAA